MATQHFREESPRATAANRLNVELPAALKFPIDHNAQGAFILYEGQTSIARAGSKHQASASGQVAFHFAPQPSVTFDIILDDPRSYDLGEHVLYCGDVGVPVFVTRNVLSSHGNARLAGRATERIVHPADKPASRVMFLVPNLEVPHGTAVRYPSGAGSAARLVLSASDWRITLDEIDGRREVVEQMKANRSIAATHVGALERTDGRSFSASEGRTVLESLQAYLSFVVGRWTGPCLAVGVDDNDVVWTEWEYSRVTPYRYIQSWVAKLERSQVERPFVEFFAKWQNPNWHQAIKQAVHWYAEAQLQAGSIEGAIVLLATAFELLAFAVMVENEGLMSNQACDDLGAKGRLEELMRWAGIQLDTPDTFVELILLGPSFAKTASALIEVRRTIAHPTKSNRAKLGQFPGVATTQAWRLGLWVLELVLLRLFNYSGTYRNRITAEWSHDNERVPWADPAGPV